MGDSSQGSKKNLNDLSREELLEKCKNLLQLAQKAKAAKDEALKECLQLKLAVENTNVLQEMVESLTQEKVEFVLEKDDLKKKNANLEKNADILTTRLESAKKVIDERDDKLDSLRKKLENLESTNAVNVRQLDRCQLENEGLLSKIDLLDKKLKKALIDLESQTHLTSKCEQIEDENCNLKAIIAKLEQSLCDKENTIKSEQEAWEEKMIMKEQTYEEAISKFRETEELKFVHLSEELEKAKSVNMLLGSELEKLRDDNTDVQNLQVQIAEANEEVESLKNEMSRKEKLEEEKIISLHEEIKAKNLRLKESIQNCEILQEKLKSKEINQDEGKKEVEELRTQMLNVKNELDILLSERLVQSSRENDFSERIALLEDQINTKNSEYDCLQQKYEDINKLLNSATEQSKIHLEDIKEKQELINSLGYQIEEFQRDTSELRANEEVMTELRQQLHDQKDELIQMKVERDVLDSGLRQAQDQLHHFKNFGCDHLQIADSSWSENFDKSFESFVTSVNSMSSKVKVLSQFELDVKEKADVIAFKEKEISDLREKLNQSEEQISQLKSELQSLEHLKTNQHETEACLEKQIDIETLKDERNRFEQNVVLLENKLAERIEEVELLTFKHSENTLHQQSLIENISLEKAAMSKELSSLKEEKSKLTELIEDSDRSISEYRQKLQDVEEKLMNTSKLMEEMVSANASEDLKTTEQVSRFQADFEQLSRKYEEETKKVAELEENLKSIQESSIETEKNLTEKTRQLEELQNLFDERNRSFEETLFDKDSHIQELSNEIEDTKQRVSKEETETKSKVLQEKESEIEMLNSIIHELKSNQSGSVDQISELNKAAHKLSREIRGIKTDECSDQPEDAIDFYASLQEITNAFAEFTSKHQSELVDVQLQNTGMLEEMSQMNKELKQRGEKVAVVNEKCDELIRKLEIATKSLEDKESELTTLKQNMKASIDSFSTKESEYEKKLTDLNQEICFKEESINSLQSQLQTSLEKLKIMQKSLDETTAEFNDKLIARDRTVEILNQKLEDQRRNFNEKSLASHHEESQSEVMSTSTISKAEETNRMADIEASFEERYTKMKTLAIKLKKKVDEQAKRIIELESTQKDGNKLSEKLGLQMSNFANLQSQYDSLQDTADLQKKEIGVLKKDLEGSVAECVRIKEKLIGLEADLADKTSKLSVRTNELSVLTIEKRTLEDKLASIAQQIDLLSQEKKELTEKAHRLSAKSEELSNINKKQDLLDMELEEAEARIAQLSLELGEASSKLAKAESDLEIEKDARKNRELQLKDVEETLKRESERAQELKAKLNQSRQYVETLESDLTESKKRVDSIQKDLDEKRCEFERKSEQMAELSGKTISNVNSLTSRNESLQKMVNLLQSDVERKDKRLLELETRLHTTEKDFESYKVRAQSVLRQTKDQDSQNAKKPQEVSNLERLVESLNQKIQDISTQHSALELEKRHQQEDHDRLMERHSVLMQEMATKEKAARDKVDQLNRSIQELESMNFNSNAHWQQEIENQKQKFCSDIEVLNNQHSSEVARLQQQIDKLDNQIIRLQMLPRKSPNIQNNVNSSTASPQITEVEVGLLEREAAEGSESVEAVHASRGNLAPVHHLRFTPDRQSEDSALSQLPRPLLPLDQLLLQKDDTNYEHSLRRQMSESSTIGQLYNDGWADNSIALEKRASSAEKQVNHMASLLSESEAENARLIQLLQVLKEEIRSYQRSEERSKHIENLEYVKNVILKFLTLPESVERARLIPVLSTILKLSNEEVLKIQTVAKEPDAHQVSDSSWTSYLGLWNP